jgi:hypothetical protein
LIELLKGIHELKNSKYENIILGSEIDINYQIERFNQHGVLNWRAIFNSIRRKSGFWIFGVADEKECSSLVAGFVDKKNERSEIAAIERLNYRDNKNGIEVHAAFDVASIAAKIYKVDTVAIKPISVDKVKENYIKKLGVTEYIMSNEKIIMLKKL